MFSSKCAWVLTFILCILNKYMVIPQMQGCFFQGLGLEQCLDQDKNSINVDSCCTVLNLAVQAGFNCLCLLLASSSSPLPSTQLLLTLSNCYISVPPFTQCQALEPVLQPPTSPALPVLFPPDTLMKPQPSAQALPVLLPPDTPMEPPQPPTPNNLLVSPPTQEVQVPLNTTADNNSTVVATQPSLSNNNSTVVATQPSLSNNAAPDLNVSRSGYMYLTSNGHKNKDLLQSTLSLAVVTVYACMI